MIFSFFLNYMILLFLAPFIEEVLFRKILPECGFVKKMHWSRVETIVFTSFAFSLAHIINILRGSCLAEVLLQMLLALFFGMCLGVVSSCRKSLSISIAAHIGVNFTFAFGYCPQPLYIDPGTGALLFSVLTGTIGVLRFSLKGMLLKMKVSGKRNQKNEADADYIPLVIYSDDKRYWQVFEPICSELDSRAFDVVYLTSSPDDPALSNPYSHIKAEFIGTGNKSFVKLNFLKAVICLSTTPGLDVYQWLRSKDVKYYVHITHMPSELTTYKMFGTDYYDALLLSGDYQISDCRQLEEIRDLPHKECTLVGIPYLDVMCNRLKTYSCVPHERTVLLAPSWGPNSILNRFGKKLIDQLIKTGYHIIIRPHPQSFASEKRLIEDLNKCYPDIEWNRDSDNFDVLNRSDIMISDFSGVIFDFTLVFDKPVICAYTDFDKSACDAWWLDTPIWTETVVSRMGPILSEDKIHDIKNMIDLTIDDVSYKENREAIRKETWNYRGDGAIRTADYLISKYDELRKSVTA